MHRTNVMSHFVPSLWAFRASLSLSLPLSTTMHSARDGMRTGTGIVMGIGMAGSGVGLTDAVRTGMAAAIVATASCSFSTVECREV